MAGANSAARSFSRQQCLYFLPLPHQQGSLRPILAAGAAPARGPGAATGAGWRSGPSAEQVLNAAAEFGIGGERYAQYATKRWGPGWKLNATGRRRALVEIETFRDDPDGLIDKIDAEINALS